MSRDLASIIDRHVPLEVRKATKHFLSPRATRAHVKCRDMGIAGFVHDRISRETGLTKSQVAYLLKKLNISTMDYRRGQNELAKLVIQYISEDSAKYFDTIVSNIRRYLKD